MLFIFGERTYGRVDAYGGEHAQTRFFHLWFLPVAPVKSTWVTMSVGPFANGFEIQTSKRSVIAAYIRWYGPVVAATAALRAPLAIGLPIAAVFAALVAWSWSWRTLRGEQARRRSDLQLLAFGSRCPPERLLPARRAQLHETLAQAWAGVGGGRSSQDVARFGASDARQAVVAYGLLRLASLSGDRTAAACADAIARGDIDAAPAGDGPYRSPPANPAALSAELAALVARGRLDFSDLVKKRAPSEPDDDTSDGEWDTACGDAACTGVLGEDELCKVCGLTYEAGEAVVEQRFARLRADDEARKRDKVIRDARHNVLGFGLGAVAVVAIAVLVGSGVLAKAPRPVTLDRVSAWVHQDQDVEVTCDRVLDAGTIEQTTRDRNSSTTTERALVICEQGDLAMPIISPLETPLGERVRRGHVVAETPVDRDWYANLPSSPAPIPFYVSAASPTSMAGGVALGILALLVCLGLFGKGLRDLRRAHRS